MLWEFLPIFASQNKSIMNKLLSTLLLVMLSLAIGAQQKSAIKPRVQIHHNCGL